jgi:hypothetical protein
MPPEMAALPSGLKAMESIVAVRVSKLWRSLPEASAQSLMRPPAEST